MEITVVGRDRRNRDGIRVHVVKHLHPQDATRCHGIPVTSAARTLLDLAATEPISEVDRAINEARIARLVSDPSLNEQFSRYPRHRGTAALKEAISTDPGSPAPKPSAGAGPDPRGRPPDPETNVRIAGYEVDFLWREQRLILEIDGYAFHSTRRSFEHDRRKETDLAAAGMRVARVTWRQLTGEALRVATRLAAALAA